MPQDYKKLSSKTPPVDLPTLVKNHPMYLHGFGSVCMPGSTVLVIGPRAGGNEVLGALAKGCNAVAVEKDEYHFNQFQADLLQVKEAIKKADLPASKEQKIDRSSTLSQSFPAGSQYQPHPRR